MTRKPDGEASPRTRRRRELERKRAAGLAPAPPPPEPIAEVDDIETGGAGRVEIRRAVAKAMALEGKSSAVTVEEMCETFGIAERQAWRYVKVVRQAWADVEAEERPSHRAWLLQVQSAVLSDARKEKDHKAANGAIRNLIELLGLKVSKVELQEGGLDALVAALQATPAQREDRIAALEAKERAGATEPPGADAR